MAGEFNWFCECGREVLGDALCPYCGNPHPQKGEFMRGEIGLSDVDPPDLIAWGLLDPRTKDWTKQYHRERAKIDAPGPLVHGQCCSCGQHVTWDRADIFAPLCSACGSDVRRAPDPAPDPLTLEGAMEIVTVMDADGKAEDGTRITPNVEGWHAVVTDQGVVAFVQDFGLALRIQLALVNDLLNPVDRALLVREGR